VGGDLGDVHLAAAVLDSPGHYARAAVTSPPVGHFRWWSTSPSHSTAPTVGEAGPVVRELLAQRYGSLEAAAFGGRALAAGACDGRGLEAVLSRRELAVLALLPSLRSMDEIACDLSVLINRV